MSFLSKLLKGLAIGGAGLGTVLTAGAASPAIAGALGIGGTAAGVGGAAASAGGGILSKIGKIASGVGKVAGPLSKVIGPTATGLAAGAQKGRETENTAAQDTANFKLRESGQHEGQLMDRQTLALRQKEQAQAAQKNAYQLARQSALAKNMRDVTVSGVPKDVPVISFQGGARPSAYGKEGQDAAALMNRLAMQKLMDGENFAALPELERTAPATFKKPGTAENVLGGVAAGANAINGVMADREQSGFQTKILAAIEALSAGDPATKATLLKKITGGAEGGDAIQQTAYSPIPAASH